MAQPEEAKTKDKMDVKKPRDRSPAYPSISLKTAVDRVTSFDKYFGRHSAPMDKAGLAWGFKENSSQAFSTLAALKNFGMIEYGDSRTADLSTDGRDYLRAQQAGLKQEILKRCALKPKAIKTYWDKWGSDRPPDPICLDELVLKGGYNQNAAPLFLKVYDETIKFAGLSNSDSDGILKGVSEVDDDPPETQPVDIGDVVKWESGGVVQFEGRRVVALSETKDYVFVEGSATGIPVEEVTVVEPAKDSQSKPMSAGMPPIRPPAVGARQDIFSLNEGQVILQWPAQLSAESYEDFESWIQLQLRKIKRSIK